jgi:hypothetical protein
VGGLLLFAVVLAARCPRRLRRQSRPALLATWGSAT